MEMYVSVGFTFADRAAHETVTKALEQFHLNSKPDYSAMLDSVRELESRLAPLLGGTKAFEDPLYYEYLGAIEQLRVNKSGSVRLKLTTGGLGDEFAVSLKALLIRLGAKKITVRVTDDEGDEEA